MQDEIAGKLDNVVPGRGGEMAAQIQDRIGKQLSAQRFSPFQIQSALAAVSCFVSLEDLAAKEPQDRQAAWNWAVAIFQSEMMGEAADIPERPEWLPARDVKNAQKDQEIDHAQYGGFEAAMARFHTEWETPEPAAEVIDDEEPSIEEEILAEVRAIRQTLEWFRERLIAADAGD